MKQEKHSEKAIAEQLENLNSAINCISEALKAIHEMQLQSQAIICALIDTHQNPKLALSIFDGYLEKFSQPPYERSTNFDSFQSACVARFAEANSAIESDALIRRLKKQK